MTSSPTLPQGTVRRVRAPTMSRVTFCSGFPIGAYRGHSRGGTGKTNDVTTWVSAGP